MSIKVLYVGHYREGSGVSNAAINYIRALVSVGIDVVCRPIKLNNNTGFSEEDIIALEKKSLYGTTHCIQHLLPHHMMYYSGMKNIGLFVNDTFPTPYFWTRNLELMDEIWCPTNYVNSTIENIQVPVQVVPHTFNLDKYNKIYAPYNIPEVNATYKFYTIGEANKRKNIADFVRAFHSEFKSWEPVSLIIKTNHPSCNPDELAKHVANDCNKIKADLRLYPHIEDYRPEVIITNRASDSQIYGLHQYGDCYVSTSRAEGWNIPLFDAAGFKKYVIAYSDTDTTMYPYLGSGYKNSARGVRYVKCQFERCLGYEAAFPWIGTGREEWLSSNLDGLCDAMRFAYETRKRSDIDLSEYSFENVGNLMKELLNANR